MIGVTYGRIYSPLQARFINKTPSTFVAVADLYFYHEDDADDTDGGQ